MAPAFMLLSMEVSKELNRIPSAQLLLADGNVASGEFPVSDSAFFEPGKEIEIKLRYEGETEDMTVFKGRVMCQGMSANGQGSSLSVELKDSAIKLTHTRRNAVFRDLSDADIIGRIIDDGGLTKGEMATTEPVHAEIVQYNASNWDFMLSRADIHGLVVMVDDGTISLNKIDLAGEALHQFEFGLSEIFDFDFELDASHQYTAIESVAWDLAGQTITEPSPATEFSLGQGNLSGAAIAEAVGFDDYRLSHPVPLDHAEQQAWADGRMIRSRMAMIKGRLSVPGVAEIKPFDLMEVAGTGARFNGKTMVTGVRHLVDEQGWRTDVQFGLSPDWYSRRTDIPDVASAGLLPPISGLQVGVVDAFEADPDEQLRVRITLPAIDAEDGVVWARLATPDAGVGRGFFFRPEAGDEVVVGFLNNDPRQAVILGAMYSSTTTPPDDYAELAEDNLNKGIVTKKGTKISFIDADKASVFIETAQSNKILLDDDTETIEIVDQHGNSITMSSSGIEIKSASDFKIDASGDVEIKGSKVDVK